MAPPLLDELRGHLARLRPGAVRPARGCLKHDCLVCGGYYAEQWDWDGFFMHENYNAETGAPLAPAAHQAPRFILNDSRLPQSVQSGPAPAIIRALSYISEPRAVVNQAEIGLCPNTGRPGNCCARVRLTDGARNLFRRKSLTILNL